MRHYLEVNIHAKGVEDKQELAPWQLNCTKGINWAVSKEAQHLVVWVDEGEGMLVAQQAVDGESGLVSNTQPAF